MNIKRVLNLFVLFCFISVNCLADTSHVSSCQIAMDNLSKGEINKHREILESLGGDPNKIFLSLRDDYNLVGTAEMDSAIKWFVEKSSKRLTSGKENSAVLIKSAINLARKIDSHTAIEIIQKMVENINVNPNISKGSKEVVTKSVAGFLKALSELPPSQQKTIHEIIASQISWQIIKFAEKRIATELSLNSHLLPLSRFSTAATSLIAGVSGLGIIQNPKQALGFGGVFLITATAGIFFIKETIKQEKSRRTYKKLIPEIQAIKELWANDFKKLNYAELKVAVQQSKGELENLAVSLGSFVDSATKDCFANSICRLGPAQLLQLAQVDINNLTIMTDELRDAVQSKLRFITNPEIGGRIQRFLSPNKSVKDPELEEYAKEIREDLVKFVLKHRQNLNKIYSISKELSTNLFAFDVGQTTAIQYSTRPIPEVKLEIEKHLESIFAVISNDIEMNLVSLDAIAQAIQTRSP